MHVATTIILCLIIYDSNLIPVQCNGNNNNYQGILARKVIKSTSKYKYQQASNLSLSEKFRKISFNEEKPLETKQGHNETVDKMEKENASKCDCTCVGENSRQTEESDRMKTMAKVSVDVLLALMRPLFGLPGVILGNLVRPLLTYMATRLFTGGQTFIKNMMSEENQGALRDEPYAAYPVYIPGYGSYILLSDIGPSELINTTLTNEQSVQIESKDIPESEDIEEEDIKRSKWKEHDENNNNDEIINVSESSVHNIKDRRENNKKYRDVCKESDEVIDENERNEIISDNEESAETKDGNDNVDSNVDDKNNINLKFSPLFLGQTHLIPIIKKPNVFESEKDLEEANWSGETGDSIRESIKQIVGSGAKIKSLKKRIMLNIVEKLRGAILEF